jgi:hypothetical protein
MEFEFFWNTIHIFLFVSIHMTFSNGHAFRSFLLILGLVVMFEHFTIDIIHLCESYIGTCWAARILVHKFFSTIAHVSDCTRNSYSLQNI